jgi:hypothetical protein
MAFAPVVARIKEQCPDFAYVEHILTSAATYPLPAALVVPVKIDAIGPRINIPGGYAQDMEMTVGIYIVMPRRQDNSGVAEGAELFDSLCAQLRAALVNWTPPEAVQPMEYAGGQMAPYEPGVVTWREDFLVRNEMRLT